MNHTFFLKFILTFIFFVLPLKTFGIAMVNEPIIFNNALQNSEFTASLYLINNEKSVPGLEKKTTIYQLIAEGRIADWMEFYKPGDKNFENPITEIEIQVGSHVEPILKITVPKEEHLPNGSYTGSILITQSAGKAEKNGLSTDVNLSLSQDVTVNITDEQDIKFSAMVLPFEYKIKNGDTLRIKATYKNLGNVSIKPDIRLSVINADSGVQMGDTVIYPYPNNEKAIMPFEERMLDKVYEWPTAGRVNGNYVANAEVLFNGEKITEKKITFTIADDNKITLTNNLSASIFRFFNPRIMWPYFAGGLLTIICLFFIFKKINKRKFNNE